MIEDRFDARKTTHGLADEIAVMCSPEFCVRLCIAVQIVELENGNRGHGPSFLKSCRSPIQPEICSAIRCRAFSPMHVRSGHRCSAYYERQIGRESCREGVC